MTIVDLLILVIVAGAVVHGVRLGAAVQVASFVGLWVGLALGASLAPAVSRFASNTPTRIVLAAATLFGTAAILSAVGRALAVRLIAAPRIAGIATVDAGLGAVVGGAAMLLATWLIASMLATLPLPQLTSPIQRSAILHAMNGFMPPAPRIFSRIQRLLDPAGFPNVFAEFEPPAASPLPLPTDPAVRAAILRAEPSTVKIVGSACGEIIEGSGFVVAPGTVVTNAHVVAGEHGQAVQDRGGSHPSFAVAFDPKLDIAVLHVTDMRAPVLAMTSATVPRGTRAAVLGYPGGGPLFTQPAVVLREETALGRDIYGQGLSARDIYELHADVRPGNSGGPVINTDATVIGVVFGRSVRTGDVGYAITSAEASSRVRTAGSAPVSTGPCAAG